MHFHFAKWWGTYMETHVVKFVHALFPNNLVARPIANEFKHGMCGRADVLVSLRMDRQGKGNQCSPSSAGSAESVHSVRHGGRELGQDEMRLVEIKCMYNVALPPKIKLQHYVQVLSYFVMYDRVRTSYLLYWSPLGIKLWEVVVDDRLIKEVLIPVVRNLTEGKELQFEKEKFDEALNLSLERNARCMMHLQEDERVDRDLETMELKDALGNVQKDQLDLFNKIHLNCKQIMKS
eukprot:TRINITY_DN479_c0_g2_i1.p1 TRINITY_DN479_c0_g2~~TRINITY_DN479_c0_g2_i1.p1  ORF type:complete len:235 (+),score=16.69 TRINITY_DN479_c0_g2_i1:508-1212(+)